MPAEPATEPHADPSGPRWVRADTTSILVILAVALAARFIFLYEAQACPLSGFVIMDGKSYSAWADRIVAGDLLGSEVFYQAPLYPYLLALLKLLVGSSLLAIKSVQMVLGALSCVLLFLAGRLLFSRAVATAAGLGLALYAPAIFFDSLIQKAGLTTLLTCFLLYLLARAGARPSVVRFAALGGAVALLTLTREETILLLPALAAWALWRFAPSLTLRPRLIRIAALLLGAGLTLLPVALRNALVGGQFALTTSQAGPNFYIGNNPAATGTYAPLRPDRSNTTFERMDAFELAEQAEGRPLTPREVSRFWFGRALDFITSDPKAYAALLVRKAGLLVASHEIPDSEDQYFFERYSPFLRTISPVSHFGLLLPLAAAGVVLTLRRFRSLSGLHIVIVTVGVAVMLFYVFGRYRFPLVPPLMLFAAAALPALTLNWRTAQRRLALAGLAALVAFAILSNH
ncbi:MAG: glycosyltransferase family 39 protein, partial [Phycisphaerales bacterium]